MNLKLIKTNTLYKYKELCDFLEEECKGGKSKAYQLKNWTRYMDIKRVEKANYIISEIYTDPKPKVDGRIRNGNHPNTHLSNIKDYPNFKISKQHWSSKGVYSVILNNDIYIGSTITGFRQRFHGHNESHNPLPTLHMLNSGATFNMIKACNDMTEQEIRDLENEYIEKYRKEGTYNVINSNVAFSFENRGKHPKKPKQKTIRIKIDADMYDEVINKIKELNIEGMEIK